MSYFAAQDFIIAHLSAVATLSSVPCRVLPAAGWKQAVEQLQAVPGIFVWHQQDRVPTGDRANRGNGRHQIVDQVYTVVVGVKNVSSPAGTGAQKDAEPLIEVVQSLQGAKLSPDHGYLFRVQSQYMSAYVNGFGVYPFAFQTRIFT